MNGAPRFVLSEFEGKKALKVFGWSVGSAFVALLLSLVGAIEFPPEYAFVVPVINSVLYLAKEWIADNSDVSA